MELREGIRFWDLGGDAQIGSVNLGQCEQAWCCGVVGIMAYSRLIFAPCALLSCLAITSESEFFDIPVTQPGPALFDVPGDDFNVKSGSLKGS